MKIPITVTSQGQATIPVAMRRKLGLGASGGVLMAELNERVDEVVLTKPVDIERLSDRISRHIKAGTTPVLDVDSFYQTERRIDS